METFEAIRTRLEVREFRDEKVPDEVKLKILEAGRLSPTGINSQHWRFILVENKEGLKKLAEASTTGKWVEGADFAVVIITNPKYGFHMIDAGRCVQDMQLVAWEEGVGSCIYTGFDEKKMRYLLNVPEELNIATVVGFGYPAKKIRGKKNRRPLSELAFSEKYGNKLRI